MSEEEVEISPIYKRLLLFKNNNKELLKENDGVDFILYSTLKHNASVKVAVQVFEACAEILDNNEELFLICWDFGSEHEKAIEAARKAGRLSPVQFNKNDETDE